MCVYACVRPKATDSTMSSSVYNSKVVYSFGVQKLVKRHSVYEGEKKTCNVTEPKLKIVYSNCWHWISNVNTTCYVKIFRGNFIFSQRFCFSLYDGKTLKGFLVEELASLF